MALEITKTTTNKIAYLIIFCLFNKINAGKEEKILWRDFLSKVQDQLPP